MAKPEIAPRQIGRRGDQYNLIILAPPSFTRDRARLRASYTQRPDHPVILGLPESSYLKGHLLEMAPGR